MKDMKGLDQFLAKIRENPRATLISRYLTLVAEIEDENQKAERALDLAESLVKSRPQETLRLAHMVFGSDPTNLRALDLLIAAMESRGRAGKAEVLKIEREKIAKQLGENPVREPSARLPQALFAPIPDDERSDVVQDEFVEGDVSRIAEIDLGPIDAPAGQTAEAPEFDGLAHLFPNDGAPAPQRPAPVPRHETVISSVAVQLGMLEGMPEHKPIDTVLPGGLAVPSTPDQLAPTLHLDALSLRTAAPEEREVRPALRPESRPAPQPQQQVALPAPDVDPTTAFWQTVQGELANLAAKAPALLVPYSRVEQVQAIVARPGALRPLPDGLIRQLVELDHTQAGALDLKWNFIQALFSGSGGQDPRMVPLLEAMGLTDASPGFLGSYLDGLLAAGRSRRALVEMRRVLTARPHLAWAHVVWARLPRLWTMQRVHGFVWSEDDGVPSLLAKLAQRPRPKLAALVAVGLKAS